MKQNVARNIVINDERTLVDKELEKVKELINEKLYGQVVENVNECIELNALNKFDS